MDTLKPCMVRTIYHRVKRLMYEQRASTVNRWQMIQQLVLEGYDRDEVEESIALLYDPVGLFYEKSRGHITLVR